MTNHAPDIACICDRILSRLFVTLACANHGAISDTQPGRERPPNRPWGRGGVPEVGSLTSRLLSNSVRAPADTADALSFQPAVSLSANSDSVSSYVQVTRSRSQHDRCDAATRTPPRRGDVVPPAPSPPPHPPRRCVTYFAKPSGQPFAIGSCDGSSAALEPVKSHHETRCRRDSEGRIGAPD